MKQQPKVEQKKRNWTLPLILLAAIIGTVLYLSKRTDGDYTSNALEPITATAAQKLASIDALSVTRLPADDKRVLKVDTLLNVVSASYKEDPDAIANATYVAHEQLGRMGKQVTNTSILEHMSMVAPIGVKYKQAVMAYAAEVGK